MRVIILHGWSYSTEKWKPLLKQLKDSGLEVEMPLIPVLSQKTDKAYSVDDYMAWLKEIVGEDKVVLIGHSNGGRLILNFSILYPDNVDKLILIDSAGIPRTEITYRLKKSIFWSIAKLGKPLSSITGLRKLLYKMARAHDYMEAEPLARLTMRNLIKSDSSLDLSAIKAPTTIIWGSNDSVTAVKDSFVLAKKIKQAQEPIIIDGARHSPQFTHTDQVAQAITEAIKE